ncbi:MAG: hypothetical protein J1E02_07670 [Coprobacter sp.]|nr:hypothetical protein [Coprobacter sp.]
MTSSVVKKGGAQLIGAAVGTFLAPGIGTFIGSAVGSALASDSMNQIADTTNDALYGEADLEFTCPNCGYTWIASGTADSETNNQMFKDQQAFLQAWEYLLENIEDITSSVEKTEAFLSEYDSKSLISPLPNSEMCFMQALAAYCAADTDSRFLTVSRKYINRAIRLFNDKEYHLFSEVLDNKAADKNSRSIVRNSIKLLDEIDESSLLLSKDWYINELRASIQEEVKRYKEEKIGELRSVFIGISFVCVPIILFLLFKWLTYEKPDSFWAFNWGPLYFCGLLVFGISYMSSFIPFFKEMYRSDAEWEALLSKEYGSFKWSSLLK